MLPRSVEDLKSIASYGQEQRKSLLYSKVMWVVKFRKEIPTQKKTQRQFARLRIQFLALSCALRQNLDKNINSFRVHQLTSKMKIISRL